MPFTVVETFTIEWPAKTNENEGGDAHRQVKFHWQYILAFATCQRFSCELSGPGDQRPQRLRERALDGDIVPDEFVNEFAHRRRMQ